MTINETVLEMHYHRPLMNLFRETYGVGPTGSINFYKYSPQREAFIGFDQAYVKTELTDHEFFELLKNSAMNSGYELPSRFVGYFMQFKVVSTRKNFTGTTPTEITNRPHYRVSLDTTRKITTGFSQHELLYNLNKNAGAMVYYACPMIFDKSSLYDVSDNLDELRLADLNTCPSAYTDNNKHYIYFNDPTSEPIWCSEPVLGKAISPKQFFKNLTAYLKEQRPEVSSELTSSMLSRSLSLFKNEAFLNSSESSKRNAFTSLADSLTIIRVQDEQ